MGSSPVLAEYLQTSYNFSPYVAKRSGAVASGVVAATLSHPMDTAKTCMQGDIEYKTYGGLTATIKTLHSEGGMGRFFNGWSWRTGRMICAIFIFGECKTRLAPIMYPKYFKDD